MARKIPTTPSPPRALHLFPFPCPQFSLRQTFLQLPRHTPMLPPTRPLLCGLYCHRHTWQRREHNRRAKLKQLAKNTPISAELSLRYWHSTDTIAHSSPPSTLPHTQTMTRPGSMNTCTFPDGNLHSTGLTFHSASNSKQTVGNSAGIEPISFHALPITYRLFRRLRRRLHSTAQPILYTSHKLYTPSPSFEISPNTHEHPLTPSDNSVPASTPILKSTPFVAWPPAFKNQDAAGPSTFSTKP